MTDDAISSVSTFSSAVTVADVVNKRVAGMSRSVDKREHAAA